MPTPPPQQRPELIQRTIDWLRSEYENGDDLLLHIADRAHDTRCLAARLYYETTDESILTGEIIHAATSRVEQWRVDRPTPGRGAQHAAADALAAILIRDWAPKTAERLTRPWDTANQVRARIRDLGDRAEDATTRLLPTWHAEHLEGLPEVVARLVESPGTP